MAASELLQRYVTEWWAATAPPFLDGVRDGGLSVAAFSVWLRQDHLFVSDLLAFQARLLATAPRSAQAVLAAGLVALAAELSWFEEQMGLRGLILVAARHPTTETYRQELERLLAEPFEVAITALGDGARLPRGVAQGRPRRLQVPRIRRALDSTRVRQLRGRPRGPRHRLSSGGGGLAPHRLPRALSSGTSG